MATPTQTKLAVGVDVVSVQTALNFYPRNLLAEIFQFRAQKLKALKWRKGLCYTSMPNQSEISETDSQDTPGTIYFSKSDCVGNLVGTIRLSPSIDDNGKSISMLGTDMSHLVYKYRLPRRKKTYEASRLILDKDRLNTKELRKPVVDELLGATVLYAMQNEIDEFFGFMINEIWDSTYQRLGFKLKRLGRNTSMSGENGIPYIVSARRIRFDEQILKNANFPPDLINFGENPINKKVHTDF